MTALLMGTLTLCDALIGCSFCERGRLAAPFSLLLPPPPPPPPSPSPALDHFPLTPTLEACRPCSVFPPAPPAPPAFAPT
ncbi:hypothetical protein T484DRAFT_1975747, partial [Baffinella frigidus]